MVDLTKRLRGARASASWPPAARTAYLTNKGIPTEHVLKVTEGRPHVVDKIVDGEVDLVINTTFGKKEIADSFSIRRESLMHSVPYYTTVQAARMAVGAIEALVRGRIPVIGAAGRPGLEGLSLARLGSAALYERRSYPHHCVWPPPFEGGAEAAPDRGAGEDLQGDRGRPGAR